LQNSISGTFAGDADERPSGGRMDGAVQLEAIDGNLERDAARTVRRIAPELTVHTRKDLVAARRELSIEQCAQRLMTRRRICALPE
jgi:hypothetical protein